MPVNEQDMNYMKQALALAEEAAACGEVPVGAIVVRDGEIIGKGYNRRETWGSAIAHAEILAIEEACRAVGSWRLNGCTLYVTLEPCPMCTGAIVNARVDRVVFGVKDPAAGCCGSVLQIGNYPFARNLTVESGVCEEECAAILTHFFKQRRKENTDT